MVVEEFLDGDELSVLALCDGESALPLAPARDYKRIGDGDTGPNTGGMGAFSPVPEIDGAFLERVRAEVHQPVLDELNRRGTPFHGVLYAGLMLTTRRLKVLEYNVRFGDPETQVVLPRLRSDLLDLLRRATTPGGLAGAALEWDERAAVTVVLASRGYPASSSSGDAHRGAGPRPRGGRGHPRGHRGARRRHRDRGRPGPQRDGAGRRRPRRPGRRVCCRRLDRLRRAPTAPGHCAMSERQPAETVAEPQVEEQFADMDVDAPRVGIVMGSKSDMDTMDAAAKELEKLGIRHEVRVMSAHRDPDVVADYAKNAKMRGLRVIIAGAGLSAALPGVVAAHTPAARHRRAADLLEVDRGRPGRAALDRPDAAGRARGVRRRGQPAQRGGAGRADPRRLEEPSSAANDAEPVAAQRVDDLEQRVERVGLGDVAVRARGRRSG